MAITAEQVDLLNNRFGALAAKVALGTLIQNAESVAASEIALAEGKVLVGNASGVAEASTLASTQLLVGSSAGVATPRTVTGDVTISNTGVTAIGSTKVLLAMLATALQPSHVVKFAGKHTTLGGDATEVITVTGLLTTDVVHVTLQTKGATPRTIVAAVLTADTITVEMSGDPSTDHILAYSVLRATA